MARVFLLCIYFKNHPNLYVFHSPVKIICYIIRQWRKTNKKGDDSSSPSLHCIKAYQRRAIGIYSLGRNCLNDKHFIPSSLPLRAESICCCCPPTWIHPLIPPSHYIKFILSNLDVWSFNETKTIFSCWQETRKGDHWKAQHRMRALQLRFIQGITSSVMQYGCWSYWKGIIVNDSWSRSWSLKI